MEKRYIERANWIRAAVLGANDGILSTASLAIGVAAAGSSRFAIVLASVAGLIAGASSMAAGEYVSVCSQIDVEKSDIERQKRALEENPEEKLGELAEIYRKRGLPTALARKVALVLTANNALEAHARDTLGIHELTRPKPLQAALASAASFTAGALLPLLLAGFAPLGLMIPLQYACSIFFLALCGACAARLGGCPVGKTILRIVFWGTLSMLFTAAVGHCFEISASVGR